jgi:hypothetical protein
MQKKCVNIRVICHFIRFWLRFQGYLLSLLLKKTKPIPYSPHLFVRQNLHHPRSSTFYWPACATWARPTSHISHSFLEQPGRAPFALLMTPIPFLSSSPSRLCLPLHAIWFLLHPRDPYPVRRWRRCWATQWRRFFRRGRRRGSRGCW